MALPDAVAVPAVWAGSILVPAGVFAAVVALFARRPAPPQRVPSELAVPATAIPDGAELSSPAGRVTLALGGLGVVLTATPLLLVLGGSTVALALSLPGVVYLAIAGLALWPPALGRPVRVRRGVVVAAALAVLATAVYASAAGPELDASTVAATGAVFAATTGLFALGVAVGRADRGWTRRVAAAIVGVFALGAAAAGGFFAMIGFVALVVPVALLGTPPYVVGRALGRY